MELELVMLQEGKAYKQEGQEASKQEAIFL
jgi:hypothetical protein